jgi:hypothetical protein
MLNLSTYSLYVSVVKYFCTVFVFLYGLYPSFENEGLDLIYPKEGYAQIL